jgi:hypothetical protein
MKRDDLLTSEGLIELLCLWWRYESQWMPVRGFPTSAAGMDKYRASRQHDDTNGAQETDERGKLAKRVGLAVQSIPEPERTALYMLARNRASGVSVWSSPRLPQDEIERAVIVSRALDLFGMMV